VRPELLPAPLVGGPGGESAEHVGQFLSKSLLFGLQTWVAQLSVPSLFDTRIEAAPQFDDRESAFRILAVPY
jgi:hypothetical protein